MPYKRLLFILMLITSSSLYSQQTYLHYPASSGGSTSWSSSTTDLGSLGGVVATTINHPAPFSKSGTIYSIITEVYFDVSGLGIDSINIDSSTSDTIDLNSRTFTVNVLSGQIVNFVAALKNTQVSTSGGLIVSGNGILTFANGNSQYSFGMDLGAISIIGPTVTLPGVIFGVTQNNGGGQSYSSITLDTAATLILNSGTQIGSQAGGIAVPITVNDSSSTIQLAPGATASIVPKFQNTNPLNIDSNGGALNIYGNEVRGTPGSAVNLNINDTAGTGTVNLYGNQSGSAGGNDYANTNVSVASGTLNLQLDTTDQSLSYITMTGGKVTGAYYAGNVTLSGNSFFSGSGTVNSVTMSGTSVISTSPTSASNYGISSSSDFTATSGTPHYYVNYDGTNYSQIYVGGNANIPNLSVNLLLAAGTYAKSTNPQSFAIINAAGPFDGVNSVKPTANPTWNPAGVVVVSTGKPATGTELQLSLVEAGTNLNLEADILQELYVAITQTSAGTTQDPIGSVTATASPTTVVDTSSIINAAFNGAGNTSKDVAIAGTIDVPSTFTDQAMSYSRYKPSNISPLENIIRAAQANGPISFSTNETCVWGSPYASRSRIGNTLSSVGQHGWTGGSLVGLERSGSKRKWSMGMLTGLSVSRFHQNGDPDTHTKANGYILGLYNTLKYTDHKDTGNFGHELLIARITNSNTMQRTAISNNVTSYANAVNKSTTNLANGQLNYLLNLQESVTGRFSLGTTYTDESSTAYTEKNALTNYQVGAQKNRSLEVYFGPGVRQIWHGEVHTYHLTAVYEYGVNVYNKGNSTTITTLSASPKNFISAPNNGQNKHYIQLKGSYTNKEKKFNISGSYSGTFYKKTQNHTFAIKAGWKF